MAFSLSQGGGYSINAASRTSTIWSGGEDTTTSSTPPVGFYQIYFGVAGTLSNFAVYITSSAGVTRAINLNKNGSAGSISFSIADGATGWFEETSDTESISVGDFVEMTVTRASGTFTIFNCRVKFTPSSDQASLYYGRMSGVTFSSTFNIPIAGRNGGSATESHTLTTMRFAGTAKYLSVFLNSNASTAARNVRLRKNGANGNLNIAISASATGRFSDTSNTDSFVDGDTLTIQATGQNAAVDITCSNLTITNTGLQYMHITCGVWARAASATTHYLNFGNNLASVDTVEADRKYRFGVAETIKVDKFQVRASANTYSASVTMWIRKNGANGNGNVVIASSTSGLFEDTTNSDDFDSSDDLSVTIAGGTSGTLTLNVMSIRAGVKTGAYRSQMALAA